MTFSNAVMQAAVDSSEPIMFAWLNSGVGIAALIIAIIIHAILVGKWSSRIEAHVDSLRKDIPELHKHRLDTSIALAKHSARLTEGDIRMVDHSNEIAQVKSEFKILARLDERIAAIQDRLAKIERSLAKGQG